MEKLMTWENLDSFAYTNRELLKETPKGIILSFIGLGNMQTSFDGHMMDGIRWAEKNVLFVWPYNNPWNWMNRQSIDYTDEVIDVIFAHYGFDEGTPILSTGGSMGGQSALVYTRYAKRCPKACFAMYPVCDMPYHFTERPDLPRTIYSAYYNEEGTLEEVLRRYSPLHLADEMPDVPYYIYHGTSDKLVNIDAHSEKLVAALGKNRKVTYLRREGYGHGVGLTAHELFAEWNAYMQAEIDR